MAYGIIDDACLKKLAGTLRTRAGITGTNNVGLTYTSPGTYKLEDYICRIPGGIHEDLLCNVEVNIGNIRNADGKKIKISYIAITSGVCSKKEVIYTVTPKLEQSFGTLKLIKGSYFSVVPVTTDAKYDGATIRGLYNMTGHETLMQGYISGDSTVEISLQFKN